MLGVRQAGILVLWLVYALGGTSGAAPSHVLTTASEILSLTPDQAARNIPVLITGIVTVAEPNWKGMFFLQDSTGGVFVNNTKEPRPAPGDLVEVSGLSHRGGYSPDIVSPHWKKLGTAPLPEAKPVSAERLMSGAEDGQRVEVSGVITMAQARSLRLVVELEAGGYRFRAFPPRSAVADLNSILGAKARIRGTAAVSRETQQGGRLNVVMFVPQNADLIVDQYPSGIAATNQVLATVGQLLALTTDQAARGIHLSVTGVVTAAEPNWEGNFFVQDATGGAFVNNSKQPQPLLGDLVQVSGVSHAGGYAPDIETPHWEKLGTAPLPEAKPVSVERFMSGVEDGRRVEVSAVIRAVHASQVEKSRLAVELASGAYRFRAFPPISTVADPDSLVGANVRVRGTAAASFNQTLRHILTVMMFVPQESDFIVEQLPGRGISQEPFTPLTGIAQYRQNGSPELRIRVKGVVTFQRPGEDIFLHDETGGLQVICSETNAIVPGEIVEAIGFAGLERFLPVLQDAILMRTKKNVKPVVPRKVSVRELVGGFHQSDLISLQGKLLDCSLRPLRSALSLANAPAENILTLQKGDYFFSAKAPASGEFAHLASIPIGSTLEVSGICALQPDEQGKMQSAQILLVSAASVRVLNRPGWWTAERLLTGLGILLAVSLVGITWTIMIVRKNSALESSIAEKIKAREELQKAHDLLETRVEERTKALRSEMDARKEAEVRFEGVMAERRRLAQELHDTLLQGFTGIGLKLEALTSTLPDSVAATKEQLQKILERSDEYLVEARRAVWELRSPSLDALGGFSQALKQVSERALQGSGICLRFTTSGVVRSPNAVVEDHLLRICEEAVTNAAKHAHPNEVEVNLEYRADELRLRIRDNGCGFDPHGPDGSKADHFGLVGIRERAKSLAGDLSLNSRPGEGTEILVTVRLPQ